MEGPVVRYRIDRYVLLAAFLWTAVLVTAYAWDLYSSMNETREVARRQAVESYKKDVLYRRWNAESGGVMCPSEKA